MKIILRRWVLTRRLRALKRETDIVFQIRRESVRRESQLRQQANAVCAELLQLELAAQRHA